MPSIATLQNELRRVIDGEVRFDGASRAAYSTDASNYRLMPLGVVVPRHEGDVLQAVALAHDNHFPILPRGGGTSLGGQSCNHALILDFSKYLNSIRGLDPDRRTAVVEPGVVQAQLNAAAARHGLQFAPDPTTKDRCCLGGMIGNNSCGAHSVEYGKTVDNLVALDALLYDGTRLTLGASSPEEIARTIARGGRTGELYSRLQALGARYAEQIRSGFPHIPRRVSGYNLDQLLPENNFHLGRAVVGSEGTLALTLSATVALVPLPKARSLVVIGCDDVYQAADEVPWILEHRPQALEGFDQRLVDYCRLMVGAGQLAQLMPPGNSYLMVEFGGENASEARTRAMQLAADCARRPHPPAAKVVLDRREQSRVWELRESGLGASAAIPGRPRTWPGAEDAAVAPEKLADFLRGFTAVLDRHQLEVATFYGHFGDGCVHCRINFDFRDARNVANFRSAMTGIAELVGKFGGSLSGEHGDGRARSELLGKIFPAPLIDAFAEFKHAFDPDSRMNPGIIVRPDPLDANLRVLRNLKPLATQFDFSADGGFAGAASKCVGVGKCRKLGGGTMCPSYMVTREEIHSTRGRAHLLYEALNGELETSELPETQIHEALGLCLACKGCKRECPAGVDMASYKAEFLFHYYQHRRRPLAAHFFGRIHELARLATPMPGLANAMQRGPLGAMVKRILGMHPQRTPPRFAAQTFRAWFKHRASGGADPNRPRVILFTDTFTNFFEPEVAIAAVTVLERVGMRVEIPAPDLCCGRPLFDYGMLPAAKRGLGRILDTLTPMTSDGTPIVGLEPGCILTFRDELPKLFPADPRAQTLGAACLMLDEFLARKAPSLEGLNADALPRRVLLHGHCHQKALTGMECELEVLRKIPRLTLETPDSGCCGMAGAFGYEANHFEVSRAIAERVLMPAVRAASADSVILSDGFSCRSQIAQLAPGRKAQHLAQFLASLSPR